MQPCPPLSVDSTNHTSSRYPRDVLCLLIPHGPTHLHQEFHARAAIGFNSTELPLHPGGVWQRPAGVPAISPEPATRPRSSCTIITCAYCTMAYRYVGKIRTMNPSVWCYIHDCNLYFATWNANTCQYTGYPLPKGVPCQRSQILS